MFVDSINVFDCRLSEVFIEYRPTEHIAKTIRNNGYVLGIIYIFHVSEKKMFPHLICGNRKLSKQSTNADQKSLQPVFSIANCRQTDD